MNKVTIILMIAIVSIVYFAYHFFITNEPLPIQDNNQSSGQIEIIKPLDIVDNSTKESDDASQSERKDRTSEEQKAQELARSIRKSNRDELIALKNNKKISYITLGEMIDKIQSQNVTSDEVMVNLDRIKHNVKIAKQMAALTKRLHVDVDGEKEMDEDVYQQLLEIQKGLILPAFNLNTE